MEAGSESHVTIATLSDSAPGGSTYLGTNGTRPLEASPITDDTSATSAAHFTQILIPCHPILRPGSAVNGFISTPPPPHPATPPTPPLSRRLSEASHA